MALNVEHISVTKSGRRIVDDISLTVPFGSITGLLGPNGAGKTTLMHAICGLGPLDNSASSKITLDGNNLTDKSISQRVDAGLVYLPQQTSLFNSLSVAENLEVLLEFHPYWREKENEQFWNEANELLALIGLQNHITNIASTLSGGQKRKLEVIRTLLMHPKIIICDEPFAGVDPKSIGELQELLTSIAQQNNIGIVVSDHNVTEVLNGTKYIYMIFAGKVLTKGNAQEIASNPIVRQKYLGNQIR